MISIVGHLVLGQIRLNRGLGERPPNFETCDDAYGSVGSVARSARVLRRENE